MGLYDTVKCDVPLPDGWTGTDMQSKDLDCGMDTYRISADGRLMQRYVAELVPVPESEWEYVGDSDPLHAIWHEQSKTKPVWEERDTNYHGYLTFYGTEVVGYEPGDLKIFGPKGRPVYRWHEYKAKFTDGNLVGIDSIKSDDTNN
jgi:hypothetical protein